MAAQPPTPETTANAENLVAAEFPVLASPVRAAIMELLTTTAAEPRTISLPRTGLTAAELSEQLKLDISTIRFHLSQLMDAGLVVSAALQTGRRGRPAMLYSATVASVNPQPFELLAEVLADESLTIEDAERAGHSWAYERLLPHRTAVSKTREEWLTKIAMLVRLLAEWGYHPKVGVREWDLQVRVSLQFPLPGVANKPNFDLAYATHRGLLHGALRALGETGAAVEIHPTMAENTCFAYLNRAGRAKPTLPQQD